MGVIGVDEWDAPSLESGTILQTLQSPTVTVAAGASANTNFRTGLATQLSANLALAIHSIKWNLFPTTPTTWADTNAGFIQGQLTEALTQAAVSLTEPRILAGAGAGVTAILESAVGGQFDLYEFLRTAKFNPPILTIAQSLNVVATSVGPLAFDFHANIKYTLMEVSEQTLKELVQRISLATQP